jgi:putative transposase
MPKKKFSDEQIAFALRQADSGTAVGEICRKMSIAERRFIGGRRSMPGWAWPRSAG